MSEQPSRGTADGGDGTIYYWDYLQLDRILGAQELESTKHGEPAHDETLFIIVHQAYELWFKQILVELGAAMSLMERDVVPEPDIGRVVHHLERITTIQPALLHFLEILESMTPLDFLDFRDHLVPASGFQSVQFRLIENTLGVDPGYRLKIEGAPYWSRMSADHAELLKASEHGPTLLDHVRRWLERTPFLHFGDFDFWEAYRSAVDRMIERDRNAIETNPNLDDDQRAAHLEEYERTVAHFEALADPDRFTEVAERNHWQLSHDAFLAALLIHLYRDEPILHTPFRLLTALTDIDEGFTIWRHRHAIMVHRMIGGRVGTGGTSGHLYLRKTADRHRVFTDLFDLSTFLIPRSELPELPAEVRAKMAFSYQADA
jgi:tryptophan 2,3-dioxygenase